MAGLTSVRDWLQGRKTYLVCAAGILGIVIAWSAGEVDTLKAIIGILGALGGITLAAKGNREAAAVRETKSEVAKAMSRWDKDHLP